MHALCSCACIMLVALHDLLICQKLHVSGWPLHEDLRRVTVSIRVCDSVTMCLHAYQCVIDGWVWFLGGNGRESESGLDRD